MRWTRTPLARAPRFIIPLVAPALEADAEAQAAKEEALRRRVAALEGEASARGDSVRRESYVCYGEAASHVSDELGIVRTSRDGASAAVAGRDRSGGSGSSAPSPSASASAHAASSLCTPSATPVDSKPASVLSRPSDTPAIALCTHSAASSGPPRRLP